MKLSPKTTQTSRENQEDRAIYESPAIVYEGIISTRAGSPVGDQGANGGVDPADLFGN